MDTHTRALYTLRSDIQPSIYTLPTTPSTKSAVLPGPVVNSAARGMSLRETSSFVLVVGMVLAQH